MFSLVMSSYARLHCNVIYIHNTSRLIVIEFVWLRDFNCFYQICTLPSTRYNYSSIPDKVPVYLTVNPLSVNDSYSAS